MANKLDTASISLGCGFQFDRNALVLVLKISEQFCTRALVQPPYENGTTSIAGIHDGSCMAKSGEEPKENLINPQNFSMPDRAATLRNTQCCVSFHLCPPPKVLGADLTSTDGTCCFGISPAKIRAEYSLIPTNGDHNEIDTVNAGVEYCIPLPRPQDRPPDKLLTMRCS